MKVKKTITSIFMVPTLKINKSILEDDEIFINAYVEDVNREVQYKDAVYLLFKPTDFRTFNIFVNGEYDRLSAKLIEDYDYDDGFVVLVYELDPEFSSDFDLIRQGKYSKTSKDFQELFPKVKKLIKNGKHRDEISLAHQIFKKTDNLREYWEEKIGQDLPEDMEVWAKFDLESEKLDIDKIKETIYGYNRQNG